MISFFACIVLLIVSYFTYGTLVEKSFGPPDDRETPAVALADGVDYVVMPVWNVFLIQLLNIAGLGPIWGAVGGAMYGPAVFLWITFGTILCGGVHDFASGFLSMRENGMSVSEISGNYMGEFMRNVMRVFSIVLLFMVGVVFAKGPAGLLAYLVKNTTHTDGLFTQEATWLIIVIVYYFIATFMSIDKIIGRIYPIFGFCLVAMAFGVSGGIILSGDVANIPEIFPIMNYHPSGNAIWSGMFISVACGACSGFHSTQSPIMARCLKSERSAKVVFYGAMVAEGIIAMVWAGAACALYPIIEGKMTGLQEAMAQGQATCIYEVCRTTMGPVGVVLAMLGVIACPITSGDTAFRSARLTIADWFKIDQKDFGKRLALSAPLLLLGYLVCHLDYTAIWNYFAYTNQLLAAVVLWTGSMYLVKKGKQPWIAVVPAVFMTAVTMTYTFMGKEVLNLGAGMTSYAGGLVVTAIILGIFMFAKSKVKVVA